MLHILNGDATAHNFAMTGLPGKVAIWREVLSQGPVALGLEREQFHDMRATYICDVYGESRGGYMDKVVLEEEKIAQWLEDDAHKDEPVVLWFDHDLVCQVNLWYLLSRFHFDDRPVYLVTTPVENETVKGLGMMDPAALMEQYENKTLLLHTDIGAAHRAWQAYAANSPEPAFSMLQERIPELNIHKSLKAHLLRLPGRATGLNAIEEKLLNWIDAGIEEENALISHFLEQDNVYGYGDLQLEAVLEELKPLLEEPGGSRLALNDTGQAILAGNDDFMEIRTQPLVLGGILMQPGQPIWRWDWEKGKPVRDDVSKPASAKN